MLPSGRRIAAGVLAAGLCMTAGGCENVRWPKPGELFGGFGGSPAPGRELSVRAVSDMVELTERSGVPADSEVWNAAERTISLFGSANETVSVQLVVEPGDKAVRGLRISAGTLSGPGGATIDASAVRAFRMMPVRVSEYPPWALRILPEPPEPKNVYDPLVPVDANAPLAADARGRLALWVDLAIPRDAAPGEYSGTLGLTSDTHADVRATVALTVYGVVLPDARPVPAVGGFDHHQLLGAFIRRDGRPFHPVFLDRRNAHVREGLVLIRKLMRLAHRHRLDLFDRRIRPLLKRDADGNVRLIWKDYDAIVRPYVDGTAFADRLGVAAWPLPFDQNWPKPEYYGGHGSAAYAETAAGLLAAASEHLAELAGARRLFAWPCRDMTGQGAYATHARLAAMVRKADEDVPVLSQLPLDPPAATGWTAPEGFPSLVDILAPPGERFDPGAAPAARGPHPLAGAWLAPGSPPHVPSLGTAAAPADARALPWFAMKYGCTGLFLPDVLGWNGKTLAPVADRETRLFYPGTIAGRDDPLPSVRLKRLRRGLQDIAYLWILQRRGRTGAAANIRDGLARYAGLAAAGDNYLDARLGGWVRDGRAWLLARRVLAGAAAAAVREGGGHGPGTVAHRVAWRRFREAVGGLTVEQVRTLVAAAPSATRTPPERLRLTVLLDVYNPTARDVQAGADFRELPEGYAAGDAAPVAIPAGTMRVIRRTADGPAPPPTGDNARLAIPMTLTGGPGPPHRLTARVPLLRAGRVRTPPTIDGLLNDWPPRPGNTAKDFLLIGRRGRKGDGLAERQTMAFVLRDATHLYIGFRCEEPDPAGLVTRADNMVRYRQLLAIGEDLVEILLDPGGEADGPEDLYHLVVKPNGVLIAERGVGSDPPLGPVRPWRPDARVAIGRPDGAWSVELAIPLAAFGAAGEAAYWRVNFTRTSPRGAESSSWSGAPRSFYDPRNLGTMFPGSTRNGSP